MRDLILLLVGAVMALAVFGVGQEEGDSASSAIRKVIEEQQAAWNR